MATVFAADCATGKVAAVPLIGPDLVTYQDTQAVAAQVANTVSAENLNAGTINANVLAAQNLMKAWIAANPNGAILTAGQTLTLAKMLNGLCKILLGQFDDTVGT